MSESGKRRRKTRRTTSETTSRRSVKCQRPKVSAEEWINRSPGLRSPGLNTSTTRTVVKCQKPGISAAEYINNNVAKGAKKTCQQHTEQISSQCPAKVVSKGVEKIKMDQTSLSTVGSSDNTRDKILCGEGGKAEEGNRVAVTSVTTSSKSQTTVSTTKPETSCVKRTPGVAKLDDNNEKTESVTDIKTAAKINRDTIQISNALRPSVTLADVNIKDCSKLTISALKSEGTLHLGCYERNSDEQIVPIQSSLSMADMGNKWDGSSVDKSYLPRQQDMTCISPKIIVKMDNSYEGSSVDNPCLVVEQNTFFPGQTLKAYPSGPMNLDIKVRSSAPDLAAQQNTFSPGQTMREHSAGPMTLDTKVRASAPDLISHVSHTPHVSKDHVFLRTHRRTSSLQLARRLSSDLTTIPEELQEKRYYAEQSKDDLTGFSRNTLPRGFKADYDKYKQCRNDEGSEMTKASSDMCTNICRQWSADTTSQKDINSVDTRQTPSGLIITPKPHIPMTKPKGVANSRPSDNLREKVKPDNQILCNPPSVPSKPKKGESNFRRFKEAGEHIKKSVKARKHKEADKPQPSGEVCKAKSERNARRKVFHSKKTRDAHAKISIRDTSKESSQEELSKQSEKLPPKIRANKSSRGVELFKCLREKNESTNQEKYKYGAVQNDEKVSDTSTQGSDSTSVVTRKTIEDHAFDMKNVDAGDCQIGTSDRRDKTINRTVENKINKIDTSLPLNQNEMKERKYKELKDVIIFQNDHVFEDQIKESRTKDVVGDNISEIYQEKAESTCIIFGQRPQESIYLEETSDESLDSQKSSYSDNDKSSDSDKTDGSSIKTDTSVRTYDTTDDKTYDTTDDKTYDTTDDKTYDSTDKMDESEKTDSTSDEYDTTESSSSLSTSDDKSDYTDDKSSVDGVTMELEWKRRAYSRRREDSEDDREWTERSKRMTANLQWIRTEIAELKKQDQSLMRQFLQLRSTIHAMKRNQGSLATPTNAQSCNLLQFPIAGPVSASFHDLSQFGSSTSINDALINIDNDLNSNLGSLDGTSGGNEYLPQFRARTVSLVHGSKSEVPFTKPRTMTFSSGSKDATERGLYESGEIAC